MNWRNTYWNVKSFKRPATVYFVFAPDIYLVLNINDRKSAITAFWIYESIKINYDTCTVRRFRYYIVEIFPTFEIIQFLSSWNYKNILSKNLQSRGNIPFVYFYTHITIVFERNLVALSSLQRTLLFPLSTFHAPRFMTTRLSMIHYQMVIPIIPFYTTKTTKILPNRRVFDSILICHDLKFVFFYFWRVTRFFYTKVFFTSSNTFRPYTKSLLSFRS